MALIFVFSHQPSDVSSGQSSMVIETIYSLTSVEPPEVVIRKTAHAVVYLVLGILLIWLVREHGVSWKKSLYISISVAILYAISDELHQLYVPGRSGEVGDVLLDGAAAAIGVASYLAMTKLFSGRDTP